MFLRVTALYAMVVRQLLNHYLNFAAKLQNTIKTGTILHQLKPINVSEFRITETRLLSFLPTKLCRVPNFCRTDLKSLDRIEKLIEIDRFVVWYVVYIYLNA